MMIQHLGEKSELRPRVGEKTNFPKSSGELQTRKSADASLHHGLL